MARRLPPWRKSIAAGSDLFENEMNNEGGIDKWKSNGETRINEK